MQEFDTERAIGYLVKRVQQALRRRLDAALKPTGLSMAQYAVLRALADHPDASAAALARRCFVTRQSVQDLLAGLSAAGLVVAVDTPSRGRARALRLTRPGVQRLTASHDAVSDVEATMLQGIPAASRRQLVDSLTRCAENLESR